MSTSSAGGLRALCGSLVAITTVVCGLRFYARSLQGAKLNIDDWMIVPSFLTFLGMVACALFGINLGIFGHTEKEVEAAKISFGVEAALVVSLDDLSVACQGFIRISALFFYLRLFCPPGQAVRLRAFIYTAVIIISLWIAAFVILPVLQCGPDLRVWSGSAAVRAAHCKKIGDALVLGLSISDFLTEISVIVMPIPRILFLKMTLKKRLLVLLVFLTAFVSLGAVIARLAIVVETARAQIQDKSLANTTLTFMWIIEAGFSLIAVNLPSLWWLRTKTKPEEMLKSVRSVFSLRSFRSSCSTILGRLKPTSRDVEPELGLERGLPKAHGIGAHSQEKLAETSHIEIVPSIEGYMTNESSVDNEFARGQRAVGPWATV